MKFLGLVWSNLKRKKLRTTLTLLSIFVSMAGADRLIVRHKVSLIEPLPQNYEALNDRQLAAWRERHVGVVFQFYYLMPALNAARDVELPLLAHAPFQK